MFAFNALGYALAPFLCDTPGLDAKAKARVCVCVCVVKGGRGLLVVDLATTKALTREPTDPILCLSVFCCVVLCYECTFAAHQLKHESCRRPPGVA